MTRAETLPVLLTSVLALAATSGYLLDLAGFGVAPIPVLLLSITGSAALAWFARSNRQSAVDLVVWTAVGPWITSEGRSYAIADLRILPDEVRSRVAIVRTFGDAAVIKRAGVMMGDCDLGR